MDSILIDKIRKLIGIEKAGLLPELQRAMAHMRRHRPRSPYQENEWLRCDVDHISRTMMHLTGDTLGWTRKHALEAIVKTQKQEAFELIDEFYQEALAANNGRRHL